jgi:hypothetical protein
MTTFRLLATVACIGLPIPTLADDLKNVDRTIAKEPVYTKSPKYCLILLGPEPITRVWLVLDGDVLCVDRNGNGDLTEIDERVRPMSAHVDGLKVSKYHCSLEKLGELSVIISDDDHVTVNIFDTVRNLKLEAGADDQGYLKFGDRPENAPVVNGGPLTLFPRHKRIPAPTTRDWEYLRAIRADQGDHTATVSVNIGTMGLGAGSTTAVKLEGVPKDKHPLAEIEFPSGKPSEPIRVKTVLDHRC